MGAVELSERVRARAEAAGVTLGAGTLERLLVYFDLLAFWSRRINLTSFDLSVPGDAAIDRLLIEPIAAASLVRAGERRAIDLGSGGGSPAVPFMLAVPSIEMVMVEVREKKAAFLREVVRTLALPATVEVARIRDVAAGDRAGHFDLVTFRAVRADRELWRAVDRLLADGGRVLWFGGVGQKTEHGFLSADRQGATAVVQRSA